MRLEDFQLPDQWKFCRLQDCVATFQNEAGDGLSINYFPTEPDIGADISDAGALRAFYRAAAEKNNLAMIEVDPAKASGLPAVRTILKSRMQPRGFAFIGCYTLPFVDHSYVIKVQSVEHGVTGMRETAVMLMQETPPEVNEKTGMLVGWERDPYDPQYVGTFMRNLADDSQYDAKFPEHPLSKVRRYLLEISNDLQVAPGIRSGKPFHYKAPPAGIWSMLSGRRLRP